MISLYCGDCLELLFALPDQSVDAILTDPPYPREYMHLYWEIAEQAKRLLKRGGSYMAIVPHYSIPEILTEVGKHLKYRWMFSMWQANGPHPRMAMGIEIVWKPIVWWVKDAWPMGRGFIVDGFENASPDKEYHEWQQSSAWARHCLKSTERGDTVLDPLMGTGTMGIECIKEGRNFIGIEKDRIIFDGAKLRIEQAEQHEGNNHGSHPE